MPEDAVLNPVAVDAAQGRGAMLSNVLQQPLAEMKDTRLVQRAIKARWPIPEAKREVLVDRLVGIVEKTSVTAIDRQGNSVELDEKADTNAIAAARVLVAMDGQNQEAESPKSQATQVNVGVAVNTGGATAAQVAAELLKTADGRAFLRDEAEE